MPLSALPSDKSAAIEASPFEQAMLATPPSPRRGEISGKNLVEPPRQGEAEVLASAAQDNSPANSAAAGSAPAPAPPPTEAVPAAAPPLFRARADLAKLADRPAASAIPAVIPIVRPPDDPGVDDEPEADEFAERIAPPQGQAGGWRGFLSRWGG
jgi:HemY protein